MHPNVILQEIDIITGSLGEQFEKIKEYQGKIPQIELDIILSNIRELYQYYSMLEKINAGTFVSLTPVPVPLTSPEPPEAVPAKALTVPQKEESVKPKKKSAPPVGGLFGEEIPLPDMPANTQTPTRNIPAGKQEEKSVAEKLQQKPVKDLKTAIGINEKFMFVNDLFEGDLQEYNAAVDALNKCTGHAEAMAQLKSLLESKGTWQPGAPTLSAFLGLMERRFL